MIFPEMDATVDGPEITEACWGILGKSPEIVMCATSRMVAKHKGAAQPSVIACTLLPYDRLWARTWPRRAAQRRSTTRIAPNSAC
jgi:hypothetical protein